VIRSPAVNDPYRPPAPVYFPPTNDDKNMGLLVTLHYVVAALVAMFSCIFIIHIAIGVAMMTSASWAPVAGTPHGAGPPPAFGLIFVVMGSLAVIFGWTLAAMTLVAGRSIAARKRHVFCLVIAGLLCLWMPFGTMLGVFAFVMLTKPHIRAQFPGAPA